ncbi:MAG: NAD+ synthase, partial [Halomonadaceae bacterium]|nr:NAD+ synthase [Halomonadaceae bacterium]
PQEGETEPLEEPEESLYCALVSGLRDYVNKSGFDGVVLGLSGGIDSALSLAIAVDALGPQRVHAVMMPYRYTAEISREDAAEQARMLGVDYQILPIEPMVDAFTATLAETFAGSERDTTEENLQSRCRGVLLMAISNKKGLMVLTTGNKSEMAVGYATLYGDMVGGFNALKDVYKTWVYRLARWRNTQSPAIPERVITRPPSAELAPDQQDSDSLPDYDTLDGILVRYIEGDMSAEAIIDAGFDREAVYQVVKLVDRSEYKRRQAAIGVRVTPRGFGRDRRYPIVNGWQPGE